MDIIVESRVFVAIEIQVFECVVCREVLIKQGTLTVSMVKQIAGWLNIPRIERAILGNEWTFRA